MGCGGSRSSRTLPAVRFPSSIGVIGNDDDDGDKDARVYHTCCHCGRRSPLPSRASLSNSNSFFSHSFSTSNPASIPSPGPWLGNSTHSSLDDGSETSTAGTAYYSPALNARNKLVLDPTLFPDVISPFAARGVRNTNIDTACGSRFSGSSSSLSCSLSAPSSHCSDERYPLPPLSVQTEPFPRLDKY
ncbi:unnamed protein product [Ectocarpus sp. 6 AP-2014]